MKLLQFVRTSVCSAVLLALTLLLFGFYTAPNQITTVADDVPTRKGIYTIQNLSMETTSTATDADAKDYPVQLRLLGTIPIKTGTMTVNQRQYVALSGEIFGLRMYTDGVVIVATEKVQTPQGDADPADRAGLKKGDVILSVNGQDVHTHQELSALFSAFVGSPMELTFLRGSEMRTTTFAPSYSETQQKYMAGLWVRDSAAGIGTMTFYDPQSGVFAGLGHAVCDVDTGEKLPLYNGDIVKATITGVQKGSSAGAGELNGSFQSQTVGSLLYNDTDGIYGFLNTIPAATDLTPVATKDEVQTGKAQMLATVDNTGPHAYDIEIEKVAADDAKFRNMIIRITDTRLLEKTGGIVQGMSGSPIIQNGMLVGAVTHVFVNEPQRGYAIFSEYMMQKAKTCVQSAKSLAS